MILHTTKESLSLPKENGCNLIILLTFPAKKKNSRPLHTLSSSANLSSFFIFIFPPFRFPSPKTQFWLAILQTIFTKTKKKKLRKKFQIPKEKTQLKEFGKNTQNECYHHPPPPNSFHNNRTFEHVLLFLMKNVSTDFCFFFFHHTIHCFLVCLQKIFYYK